MGDEIERKFRLVRPVSKHDLETAVERRLLKQAYLPVKEGEVRLRSQAASHDNYCKNFSLAAKGDGTIQRPECEIRIPEPIFQAMWPLNDGFLEKVRFVFPVARWSENPEHNNLFVELDFYTTPNLNWLQVLECEFDTLEQAATFVLPPWAHDAVEVTDDKRFKNKNLARNPGAVSEYLIG